MFRKALISVFTGLAITTSTIPVSSSVEFATIDVPPSDFIDVAFADCLKRNAKVLDVQFDEITEISCSQYPIADASIISKMPNLERLVIVGGMLDTVDLSNNPALTHIDLSRNKLTSIQFGNSPKLRYVDLSSNNLSELKFEESQNIEYLYAFKNYLSAIEVSSLIGLKSLYLNDNLLTSIHLPEAAELRALYLYNNRIQVINGLEQLKSLEYLELFNNQIANLNIENPELSVLTVQNNPLVSIDYIEHVQLDQLWFWNVLMDEGNIQSLIEKTEEVVRGLPSIPSTPQNNSRYVSEFVQMQLDGASDSLIRAMYNYDYHKSKSYNSFSSSPGYEIPYSSLRSKSLYYFFRSTGEFIQNSVRFGLGLDEGLAWAAMAGHVNIVDELLDHGASINATFYAEVEQIPVINSLVYMNNLEMVEHFLNRGAEVPYHYTISINRSDADYWEVRKPIAKLFNHSLKGEMVHANNLPDMLIYAGMAGDNKRVEELLGFASRHGYNLAVELALNVAVFTKNSDFIEQLLSFPELSLREGYFSEALGHAIRYELLPLIAQLLEINADPFAYESLGEGTYGENAVEKAIKHPNKDVLKKMVETIPQLSVALLIQAIENEDHSTVDSWLASYNGSEFEQDFPGLQDALATAISKNDPVSFRKIIALPEGEQLLYKKYKGVELFDLAHNIEIKEFILIRTGFFDKVSPQFLDLLLESLSSGFKEQAELLIDNIPKQGFLVHDFQEHLNVSRKKDFSLYARLQRKIKELSDSQDW